MFLGKGKYKELHWLTYQKRPVLLTKLKVRLHKGKYKDLHWLMYQKRPVLLTKLKIRFHKGKYKDLHWLMYQKKACALDKVKEKADFFQGQKSIFNFALSCNRYFPNQSF